MSKDAPQKGGLSQVSTTQARLIQNGTSGTISFRSNKLEM